MVDSRQTFSKYTLTIENHILNVLDAMAVCWNRISELNAVEMESIDS